MGNYLGAGLENALKNMEDTRECHARFGFLENLYAHHLVAEEEVNSDDAHVVNHRACALRSYLMYLVGTSIFMDTSAYYIDVVYLGCFIDFEQIHEYNWG